MVTAMIRLTILSVAMVALASCQPGDQSLSEKQQTTAESRSSSVVNDAMPKMIELYTPTCPSCLAMKPLVEKLISECDKKGVRVSSLDISIESNERFIDDYEVRAVPTFLFLDENGVETARLVGSQTENTLKQAMAALRGEECPGLTILNKGGPSAGTMGG